MEGFAGVAGGKVRIDQTGQVRHPRQGGSVGACFSGYRFPDEIIALAVRWYLRFRLSYADLAEWLAERGISVDPSTIYDWVHTFTPRFIEAARRHRRPVGRKWRVDETLFKIGSRWRYAFRAIDEDGQIVDVLLSEHRDAASARAFFEQAITSTEVTPTRITTDKGQVLSAGSPYRAATRGAPAIALSEQWTRARSPAFEREGAIDAHFKRLVRADSFCRGHALIRNLRQGFSNLTAGTCPRLRLATAWTVLAADL